MKLDWGWLDNYFSDNRHPTRPEKSVWMIMLSCLRSHFQIMYWNWPTKNITVHIFLWRTDKQPNHQGWKYQKSKCLYEGKHVDIPGVIY